MRRSIHFYFEKERLYKKNVLLLFYNLFDLFDEKSNWGNFVSFIYVKKYEKAKSHHYGTKNKVIGILPFYD